MGVTSSKRQGLLSPARAGSVLQVLAVRAVNTHAIRPRSPGPLPCTAPTLWGGGEQRSLRDELDMRKQEGTFSGR